MALIKCPDCGKDVSSNAKSCLNCGCPIKEETKTMKTLNINILNPKLCYLTMVVAYAVFFIVNESTCGLICCFVFTTASIIPLITSTRRNMFDDNVDFWSILILRIIIVIITIACFIGFAGADFTI